MAFANFTTTTDTAATIGIHTRVHALRIFVLDPFGFGVSGVAAKVKVANETGSAPDATLPIHAILPPAWEIAHPSISGLG